MKEQTNRTNPISRIVPPGQTDTTNPNSGIQNGLDQTSRTVANAKIPTSQPSGNHSSDRTKPRSTPQG